MDISAELAQAIVSNMEEIIHQDINYINTEGIIIASTNTNRIGTYHGGGKKVKETNDDLIIRYDGEYTGSRKGINLPIYFENTIVGVIGITGEKQEVEKFGAIIKSMTELLIKNAYLTNIKNKERENQRMIIEELLFNDENEESIFMSRLKVFNIKENVPRIVIVSEVLNEDFPALDIKDRVIDLFDHKLMKNPDNLMMQNKNNIIMILQNVSRENVLTMLNDINQIVKKEHGLQLKFGIGTIETKLHKIRGSYKKASIALDWVLSSKEIDINYYDDMDIELIIENVTEDTKNEFYKKVIGNLKPGDFSEYKEIISLFEKFNGSIQQISESMFIHKNTLQYKLNKLHKITGYDIRNYKDFTIIKLAYLLTENQNT
ncbi:carbohydrate diacid regulator [Lentibacillus kapialis]|uniref:Carbohydrate diacid regulator n=1 Tax=Lentibacillus kapialis TaxID=340214 RepID=A0A917PZV5_9BACI|nr:sugar diacid recognition domain-containing protein [Lentibacillus kapialis]GGK01485.1 carbohydrate diacid regulator [Lentibacillus kapialis]